MGLLTPVALTVTTPGSWVGTSKHSCGSTVRVTGGGVVGAGGVDEGVGVEVVVGVARRGDIERALALGVQLGPVDRVDDGPLVGVVHAVVQPRVNVVAVVGDLDAVVGGEHEGADDALREEQARSLRVASP